MVYTEAKLPSATIHDELLNCAAGDLERIGETQQDQGRFDLNRVITGDSCFLEEASKDDLLKRSDIFLHLFISANL